MSKAARTFNEEAPLRLLLLAGWSYWLWQLGRGGNLRLFVHPRFATPVLLAAVGLCLLAVYQGSRLRQEVQRNTRWSAAKLFTYTIVVLPLVIGFAFPPGALSDNLAQQRGDSLVNEQTYVHTAAMAELHTLLANSGGMQPITGHQFRDLAALLRQQPDELVGSQVELVGFVCHGHHLLSGQFLIARYEISCCTADATAVSLLCRLPDGDIPPVDGWVTIQGVIASGEYHSRPLGVIQVQSMQTVPPPADPYIYTTR